MTRNGKIARLPLVIRQQLNQRLPNGESAQDLLSWLNRAFAKPLASVPSTAPTPPRRACFPKSEPN